MTIFLLFACGMWMFSLLFLLPPLWRSMAQRATDANRCVTNQSGVEVRDDHYSHDKRIIEGRFKHWTVSLSLLLYLLIGSGLIYLSTGNPQAMNPQPSRLASMPDIEQMLSRLEKRLQTDTEDAEGWEMLGRSYRALGRFELAIEPYAQLVRLQPENKQALIALANLLAVANGGQQTDHSMELVKRVLSLDPEHPQGLWMAGVAAYQKQNYHIAIRHWQNLLPLLTEDQNATAQIRSLMDSANERIVEQD